MIEIQMWFTSPDPAVAEDTYGYNFHDYFTSDGLDRARHAANRQEALQILGATYKGRDIHGIGVGWRVEP